MDRIADNGLVITVGGMELDLGMAFTPKRPSLSHADLIALVADRWQDVVDMCPQFVQEDLRDMQFPVGSLQRMLLDGACAIIAAELWKREHGAQ